MIEYMANISYKYYLRFILFIINYFSIFGHVKRHTSKQKGG